MAPGATIMGSPENAIYISTLNSVFRDSSSCAITKWSYISTSKKDIIRPTLTDPRLRGQYRSFLVAFPSVDDVVRVPIHDIDNITLAFRLDFDINALDSFKCEKIGDKDYTLNLFILNMFCMSNTACTFFNSYLNAILFGSWLIFTGIFRFEEYRNRRLGRGLS